MLNLCLAIVPICSIFSQLSTALYSIITESNELNGNTNHERFSLNSVRNCRCIFLVRVLCLWKKKESWKLESLFM